MNKFFLLLSLCSFFHVSGQNLAKDSVSTTSYTDFKNELIIRAFIGIKNLDYFQKNNLLFDDGMITDYDTPTTLDFGVGIHTDFFGWHFWFTTGKVLEQDPKDDKRKLLDIQANFYNQRLSYDINFQNYN